MSSSGLNHNPISATAVSGPSLPWMMFLLSPAQMPCRHQIVRNRNYTEYQADYPKWFCRREFPETMLARRWFYPCHSEPFLALYLYALKYTGLWIPAQPPPPDDIGAKWGGRVIHPCFLGNHINSKRHLRSFLVSDSETKHLPPRRCWLQAPNFTPSMLDLSLISSLKPFKPQTHAGWPIS
jgi:hypothetical protein